MSTQGYLTVPETGTNEKEHRRQLARGVNQSLAGKLNAVTTVTLVAGDVTTVLTDARLTISSYIGLTPLTANAAAAISTTYVSSRTNGSATLSHANNANVDKTFSVVIIG